MSHENKEQKKEETPFEPDWLSPLPYEHIEEKIKLNQENHDINLEELRMRISIELHQCQRIKLRSMVQEQNLTEQLDYIDYKIHSKLSKVLNVPR